jgi:FkbM family methyltransferase
MTSQVQPPRSLRKSLFSALKLAAKPLMKTRLRNAPGASKLFRVAYRLFTPKGPVLLTVGPVRLWLDPRDEGIAMFLITEGVFEPEETKLIASTLKPGMVFVDIGANLGYFTTLAASVVGPTGSVIAFEPEPGNFQRLQANIAENAFKNVEPRQCALSDSPGNLTLYCDPINWGNPSLVKANVPPGTSSVEVPVSTLDAQLAEQERVDFIKMDVQGFEARVLDGARAMLARHRPTILTEFWPDGLRNAGSNPEHHLADMQALGYRITLLGAPHRELTVAETVAACMRSPNRFLNLLLLPKSAVA